MKPEHIVSTYRIGKKNESSPKPRPLIVKFINYDYKALLIKNAKKFKGKGIFIAEDLIKNRRKLLIEAKTILGLKNVWTYNGQIFTKIDGKTKKLNCTADIVN